MIEIPNEINENRNENYLIELFKNKYEYNKKGLELRKDGGNEKGIGIYSTKSFKKGETIMKIEPYVWSVSKHGLVCDYCLKNKIEINCKNVDAFGYSSNNSDSSNTISLKRCTACKVVYYCSTDCQKKAWQIHKHECKILSTVPTGKNINTKSTTMLLRLFIKRNLEILSKQSSSSSSSSNNDYNDLTKFGQFEIIDNLLNHKEKRLNNSENSNNYKSFSSGFTSLLNQEPRIKAPIVLEYLLKLEPNCISIPKCEGSSIGLYPLMVFFNHSCKPNLSIINTRKELLIITNRNIEKGEELFINYSPAICYKNERIENLKQCFYFNCNCELCNGEEEEEEEEELFINCKLCKNGIINKFTKYNSQESHYYYKCNKCLKIYEKQEILKIINNLKNLEIKINNNNQDGQDNDQDIQQSVKELIKLYFKEYNFKDPSLYWITNKIQLFYKCFSFLTSVEISNLHSRYQAMLKYHLLENQGLEFEYCKQLIEYINILTTMTPSIEYLKLAYNLLTDLFKNHLVHIDFYGFDKDNLVLLHFNLEFQLNSNIK